MFFYSDTTKENDLHTIPDFEVFELNAHEVAEMDEDLIRQYSRKHEYRLATMNNRTREAMLDAIVENEGITGGYFFQFCFPGCLPESSPFGPYPTRQAAIEAARDMAND
jgi:hypothetical protein